MKLWQGGFGRFTFFTVAKNEKAAIENIKAKDGMASLPVTVEAVTEVDGFKIVAEKVKAEGNNKEDSSDNDSKDKE